MKKIAAFVLLFVSANSYLRKMRLRRIPLPNPLLPQWVNRQGKKTEIKINKDGGSLKSSDGMAEMIFPARGCFKKDKHQHSAHY